MMIGINRHLSFLLVDFIHQQDILFSVNFT